MGRKQSSGGKILQRWQLRSYFSSSREIVKYACSATAWQSIIQYIARYEEYIDKKPNIFLLCLSRCTRKPISALIYEDQFRLDIYRCTEWKRTRPVAISNTCRHIMEAISHIMIWYFILYGIILAYYRKISYKGRENIILLYSAYSC